MPSVIEGLSRLIEEGTKLVEQATLSEKSHKEEDRFIFLRGKVGWEASCEQILTFAQLPGHLERARAIMGQIYRDIRKTSEILGILESARNDVKAGFVGNLRFLLHADLFGSVIEQARELLRSGHMVPAAVLARIVLERWLRDQAEKAGIKDYDVAKASVLNGELKAAQLFSIPKWRQVQITLILEIAQLMEKKTSTPPMMLNG